MSRSIRTTEEGLILTTVAIDRDKNCQYAVKWAVDNLLKKNHNLTLVHVRTQSLQSQDLDPIPKGGRPPTETEMHQLFLPYRGFCARKGIDAKEVVLHDIDVQSALIDYINNNSISNIVVGASNRNAFTRKFRDADVPSGLAKNAPEFCTVYVIAKGKLQSVRSASRPATPTGPVTPRQPSKLGLQANFSPESPESEDISSSFSRGSWKSVGSSGSSSDSMQATPRAVFSNGKIPSPIQSMEKLDLSICTLGSSSQLDSQSDISDFSGHYSFQSTDMSSENLDFSITSDSSRNSFSPQTPLDLEAEMKKLKLELKQTMEMYNSACKDTVRAKQRARGIHQWKTEEARKLEEARYAEEAAMAMVEMEKQKSKAAMDAAQMAQQLAELEVKKRKNVEMKVKHEAEEKKRVMDAFAHNDTQYRRYPIEEIEVATDYFSNSLKIGEGGYGPVYKALLDHTSVAIKVLRPDISQGQKQFQQEIQVLSCMRHPNMVILVGACPEYGCLVYEYMENGNLEDRLFRKNNTPSIPWRIRFKIAAEIATALLFLHQAKPEPLVHRDLKPANILLDRNYVSKISDVGLARLVPPSVANSVTQYHMTAAAGTFCYIDPEYQQTGMLGVKSDIYSLGVMFLQIITAKPPIGLAHKVERAIESGQFLDMLDPTVTDWPVEGALSFAKLALQCCELRKKDRPDLGSVVLPELNRLRDLGLGSGESCNSSTINGHRSYCPLPPVRSDASQEGMRYNPNMEMEIQRRSMLKETGSGSSRRLEYGV
ncbi:hypothetical protein L1049_004249 [Liquidambar formosana]|uniref:RING-type E3 ubiquitin transferase n=1 Tax=Liquidambar formosana TaxID=63359 RepID=A0AAP0WVH8_LIQFO